MKFIIAVLFALILCGCEEDNYEHWYEVKCAKVKIKDETRIIRRSSVIYIKNFEIEGHEYIIFAVGGNSSRWGIGPHMIDCKYCKIAKKMIGENK